MDFINTRSDKSIKSKKQKTVIFLEITVSRLRLIS